MSLWASMTEEEKIAHSLKHGTAYAKNKGYGGLTLGDAGMQTGGAVAAGVPAGGMTITQNSTNQPDPNAYNAQNIQGVYQDLLGRQAADEGLNYWLTGSNVQTLEGLRNAIMAGDEYKNLQGGEFNFEELMAGLKPLENSDAYNRQFGDDQFVGPGANNYGEPTTSYNQQDLKRVAAAIQDSGMKLRDGNKFFDTGVREVNELLYGADISNNLGTDGETGFRTPRQFDTKPGDYIASALKTGIEAAATSALTGGAGLFDTVGAIGQGINSVKGAYDAGNTIYNLVDDTYQGAQNNANPPEMDTTFQDEIIPSVIDGLFGDILGDNSTTRGPGGGYDLTVLDTPNTGGPPTPGGGGGGGGASSGGTQQGTLTTGGAGAPSQGGGQPAQTNNLPSGNQQASQPEAILDTGGAGSQGSWSSGGPQQQQPTNNQGNTGGVLTTGGNAAPSGAVVGGQDEIGERNDEETPLEDRWIWNGSELVNTSDGRTRDVPNPSRLEVGGVYNGDADPIQGETSDLEATAGLTVEDTETDLQDWTPNIIINQDTNTNNPGTNVPNVTNPVVRTDVQGPQTIVNNTNQNPSNSNTGGNSGSQGGLQTGGAQAPSNNQGSNQGGGDPYEDWDPSDFPAGARIINGGDRATNIDGELLSDIGYSRNGDGFWEYGYNGGGGNGGGGNGGGNTDNGGGGGGGNGGGNGSNTGGGITGGGGNTPGGGGGGGGGNGGGNGGGDGGGNGNNGGGNRENPPGGLGAGNNTQFGDLAAYSNLSASEAAKLTGLIDYVQALVGGRR